VPVVPGRHERLVRLFRPKTQSSYLNLLGWVLGHNATYERSLDTVGNGEGRETTRTESIGVAKVVFNVTLRNMDKLGFVT